MNSQTYDTLNNLITIGDTVLIGSYSELMSTFQGDFYECEVLDIDIIEDGPFGNILHIRKQVVGRNLAHEIRENKLEKYSAYDIRALNETENLTIFSKGVIKITNS